ncbi:MAG: PspC domain-containing protein [Candidatus Heimdallarchaeota archaeon]|nr:PspC domain-containing protein [Candidatus Heimdallarchaeota archaeon]
MQCPQCGTENPQDAAFCRKCGRNIGTTSPESQPTTPGTPPQQENAQQQYSPAQRKRFVRCSNDKSIGGVCSGFAQYADMDVSTVRIVTLLLLLFTAFNIFWVYIIMWAVIPEEPCTKIK